MASIVSSFLVFVLIWLFLYHVLLPYIRQYRQLMGIPGRWAVPFLGNLFQISREPHATYEHLIGTLKANAAKCCDHQRIFKTWFSLFPLVIIYGAEELEPIMPSVVNINKSKEYMFLYPWMGRGLLTSAYPRWRPRRKLLTPAFHFDILKDFMPTFNRKARIFIEIIRQKTQPFDVCPLLTNCTLDIICETSMGREVNAQKSDSKYTQAVHQHNYALFTRIMNPVLWPDVIFNRTSVGKLHNECVDLLQSFTNQAIKDLNEARKSKKEANGHCNGAIKHNESATSKNEEDNHCNGVSHSPMPKNRRVFLELMLDLYDDGLQTMEDVRHEVSTFMFEGHDTTNMAMCFFLHWMGCYPDIQAKVQQELDTIFGNDFDRDVTVEDLKHMDYLEMCLKESLRITPSVPFYTRELLEDVKIKDKTIPKGTAIGIMVPLVHRDPKYWADPEKFDPNRFLPENNANRHPFAYIPFSAGPRNCIGQRFAMMEQKVLMSWLLRNFSVRSTQLPGQIRTRINMVLRPENGIWIQLTPRYPTTPA